jgi:hypothetical protein
MDQGSAERLTLAGKAFCDFGFDHRPRALPLDRGRVEGVGTVQSGTGADHAVSSQHSCFDILATLHTDDKRHDPGVREIHVGNDFVGSVDRAPRGSRSGFKWGSLVGNIWHFPRLEGGGAHSFSVASVRGYLPTMIAVYLLLEAAVCWVSDATEDF